MKNNSLCMRSEIPLIRFRSVLTLVTLLVLSIGAADLAAGGPKWVAPASANGKKNIVPSNAASLQVGKKIYTKECVSCHGVKGAGDGPKVKELTKEPGNFTTKEFESESDGAIFWKIAQGNKPMPTFKTAYSDEERWSLVNYLRTLHK
jgi:mono/diheme cytochrome c family protein